MSGESDRVDCRFLIILVVTEFLQMHHNHLQHQSRLALGFLMAGGLIRLDLAFCPEERQQPEVRRVLINLLDHVSERPNRKTRNGWVDSVFESIWLIDSRSQLVT